MKTGMTEKSPLDLLIENFRLARHGETLPSREAEISNSRFTSHAAHLSASADAEIERDLTSSRFSRFPGSRFPAELPSLGPRRVSGFRPCLDCAVAAPVMERIVVRGVTLEVPKPIGTWLSYGETPLCGPHAYNRLAGPGGRGLET
jgi:hypothetical protein